ncbi:MAG: MT-A70 family methyltransferase [Candidatus Omnitrophota bacterium]|jgi:N6-adenosine-specific RNA methylase IME4
MKKYQIIYADPPWSYADKGCQGTMANHYKGMDIKDICSLPVGRIADDNCVLFLWTTYPMLKESLRVIDAWEFNYKSIAFQWIKLNPKSKTPFYGLGRWTRGNTEPCLLATKGKPKRISASVFQLIQESRERHSKKPDIVRNNILKLMGDLPRIELFARQKTEGWDVWGNEVESDIDLIASKI